jgi:hypothetical protein
MAFLVVVPDDYRHDSFPPLGIIKHPKLYTSPHPVLLLELHDLLDIRPMLLTTLLDHFLDCLVPPHPQYEEKCEKANWKNDNSQVVGGVAVVDMH